MNLEVFGQWIIHLLSSGPSIVEALAAAKAFLEELYSGFSEPSELSAGGKSLAEQLADRHPMVASACSRFQNDSLVVEVSAGRFATLLSIIRFFEDNQELITRILSQIESLIEIFSPSDTSSVPKEVSA